MATVIKNKNEAFSHGTQLDSEASYGLSNFYKVVAIEVDDMSVPANNDVLYTFPAAGIVKNILVTNTGTTAFVIATGAAFDIGGTDHTGDFKVLAAGATQDASVDTHVVCAAGTQVLWDIGTNTSAATAKALVIIEFLAAVECSI